MPLVPAMAGGGGVNIDFDLTFVAQMVVFAGLVLILKPLLFYPVLKIFEQRELYTEGRKAEARELQEEAGMLLRKYDGSSNGSIRWRPPSASGSARRRASSRPKSWARPGWRPPVIDEGRRKIESEVTLSASSSAAIRARSSGNCPRPGQGGELMGRVNLRRSSDPGARFAVLRPYRRSPAAEASRKAKTRSPRRHGVGKSTGFTASSPNAMGSNRASCGARRARRRRCWRWSSIPR